MVSLPYDAGLSAAVDTLVGILKTVIVTPTVYPGDSTRNVKFQPVVHS